MSERDVELYLEDIFDAIQAIESYTENLAFEDFIAERKTYSATLREFIVIGEAIGKLPDAIKNHHPQVPWRQIKDFRNFIIHEYFGIDKEIVWDAVIHELPVLRNQILLLLQRTDS